MVGRIKRIISGILRQFAPIIRVEVTSLSPNQLLKGRTAIITGGTSGIGFQIARSFLYAGACVIITGRKQKRVDEACRKLLQECKEWNEYIHGIEMDVTNINQLEQCFQGVIENIGNVDILVNNAGLEGGNINSCTEEEFDTVINTNMKGVFFLSRIVVRYMVKHEIKGNILNICSSSSLRPANSAYAMSKWAVRSLTEGLARMLIPYGIVVNGIAPGPTATPMLMKTGVTEDLSLSNNLIGRYALPEEVANMAVVLVSGMCRMVVGDVLYMTGGSGLIYHEDVSYHFD